MSENNLDIKICEEVLEICIHEEHLHTNLKECSPDTPSTNGTYIIEIPSGIVDGINTSFIFTDIPVSNTQKVYLNGLIQMMGVGKDYTILGGTITFAKAPKLNNKVLVSYFK